MFLRRRTRHRRTLLLVSIASVGLATGCDNHAQRGALVGGTIGYGVDGRRGAFVGGVTGYMIGNEIDKRNDRHHPHDD
jgi:uncharacterized protein YcfJ